MVTGASAMRESTAPKVCLKPICLLLASHICEHARRSIAVVTGDNQAASRGHAFDHHPKGIGGQLLSSFSTQLLKSVARLGKLVNTFVWPMVPKHNVGSRSDPIEAVVPRGI